MCVSCRKYVKICSTPEYFPILKEYSLHCDNEVLCDMIIEEWGHEMNTRDLINEAYSLLQSLNKPETELDKKWTAVAHRRLQELQNGSVETIPGKEVFEKVWKRFHE